MGCLVSYHCCFRFLTSLSVLQKGSSLPGWAIALIVIAVVLVVIVAGVVGYVIYRRRRMHQDYDYINHYARWEDERVPREDLKYGHI